MYALRWILYFVILRLATHTQLLRFEFTTALAKRRRQKKMEIDTRDSKSYISIEFVDAFE